MQSVDKTRASLKSRQLSDNTSHSLSSLTSFALVQLYLNSQHYNGTKEVKPVIVLSLVSNCNLLYNFVVSLSSGEISMFCTYSIQKGCRVLITQGQILENRQVSHNTSHSLFS